MNIEENQPEYIHYILQYILKRLLANKQSLAKTGYEESVSSPSFNDLWVCYPRICHVNMNSTTTVPRGTLKRKGKHETKGTI